MGLFDIFFWIVFLGLSGIAVALLPVWYYSTDWTWHPFASMVIIVLIIAALRWL